MLINKLVHQIGEGFCISGFPKSGGGNGQPLPICNVELSPKLLQVLQGSFF
jgi:hypothetical protein